MTLRSAFGGKAVRALAIVRNREWIWGAVVAAVLAAVWLLDPFGVAARGRELASETLGSLFPQAASADVLVVDIDRESLARIGPWPWRRSVLAALVSAAAAQKPRAIALDVLLAGPDRKGPTALARELAAALGGKPMPLPPGTPDDDEVLADAITKAGNVVLGAVLDESGGDSLPFSASLSVEGDGNVDRIQPRRSKGLLAPYEPLTRGAAGIGVLSFQDGLLGGVAAAPVLALAGDDLVPGLALEAVRVAAESSLLVLKDKPTRIAAGPTEVLIDANADMRLHLSSPAAWAARSIPAWRLLSGELTGTPSMAGTITLIGSTAPEAGALLPIADRPLAPTVQIQADAVRQMLSGHFLQRPPGAAGMEAGLMALLGLGAAILAARLSPLSAAGSAVAMSLAWLIVVTCAFTQRGWLLDPIGPAIAILLGANVTSLASFIRTRTLKAAIQGRFERYLAPEIVARLVREPTRLRLQGELREVTALMTDVEGFSAMTERAEPQTLVHVLDAYFDGITELVVSHGGMVDKIVGDAVLAFFNMPADLPDHTHAAIGCAKAISVFAEDFRRRDGAAAIGFGRTRCGIETGEAIVGDVGGHRRLDYTAYGTVVNKASRFQDANKRLGSAICIGAVAAGRIDGTTLRSLGSVPVRGMQELCELFEPWDEGVPTHLRELYQGAVVLVDSDPAGARRLLQQFAAERPSDPVVKVWLEGRLAG